MFCVLQSETLWSDSPMATSVPQAAVALSSPRGPVGSGWGRVSEDHCGGLDRWGN